MSGISEISWHDGFPEPIDARLWQQIATVLMLRASGSVSISPIEMGEAAQTQIELGLFELADLLADRVGDARWIRPDGSALLRPNGASRSSAWQVTPDGKEIIIPFR